MNPGVGMALPIYGPQSYYDPQARPVAGQTQEEVPASTDGSYTGPLASSSFAGEPAAVWVGMLALLFIIGWYGRHADTLGGEIPRDIRVGLYNWLAVGVMAATFFLIGKIVFVKFPVPGVTNFFKAL